ncbi:SixA phosphatase family protein [Aestuariibius sp. 2305UL40-4]|uniref:SixA phosphatase family protein n=1 Tax=Aestuariibius violaceus TaxID=3234132 RepID=UPI00345E4B5F
MTRHLILIRHAKSDWSDPALGDFDRTLTKRGERSAVAIGQWLDAQSFRLDTVLISAARRTRETWELLSGQLSNTPEAHVLESLYHAPPGTILQAIAKVETGNVAIIAHNPGLAALATQLSCGQHNHPDFSRYPTCATAVFAFEDWSDLSEGRAVLEDFVIPRELLSDQGSD